MDFIDEKIEEYAFDHTSYEGDLLKQLEEETYEKLDIPQMTTGRIEARLLKMLARLVGAKRILEIGTFAGYSALSMAEALPERCCSSAFDFSTAALSEFHFAVKSRYSFGFIIFSAIFFSLSA